MIWLAVAGYFSLGMIIAIVLRLTDRFDKDDRAYLFGFTVLFWPFYFFLILGEIFPIGRR